MKKILCFTFIFILLIPQTVFAKDTQKEVYLQKIINEISTNWTTDYYKEILIMPNINSAKKDGKTIEIEKLNRILGTNCNTFSEFETELKNKKVYTIEKNNTSIKIENKYQTCRIMVYSKNKLNLLNYNVYYYDDYHGVVICNSQEETYNTYLELLKDTNITICLDEIGSANAMSTDEMQIINDNDYYSYGFEKMNIDNIKKETKYSVTVGIIDSGITREHFLFKNKYIYPGKSIITGGEVIDDPYGHGTHVSSTIAEGTNDKINLFPIQVFDENGTTSFLVVDTALKYALTQDIDCINMSLGFHQDYLDQYSFLDDTIKELYDSGIILIKSAGNHNNLVDYDYPYGKYLISVGAIDENNKLTSFSNYGPDLDFVCYGAKINGALNNLKTGTKSGTSMAAPHITACISLLKSQNKNRTFEDIYNILKENCETISCEKDIGNGVPIF